jgi:hypothetical protein
VKQYNSDREEERPALKISSHTARPSDRGMFGEG